MPRLLEEQPRGNELVFLSDYLNDHPECNHQFFGVESVKQTAKGWLLETSVFVCFVFKKSGQESIILNYFQEVEKDNVMLSPLCIYVDADVRWKFRLAIDDETDVLWRITSKGGKLSYGATPVPSNLTLANSPSVSTGEVTGSNQPPAKRSRKSPQKELQASSTPSLVPSSQNGGEAAS